MAHNDWWEGFFGKEAWKPRMPYDNKPSKPAAARTSETDPIRADHVPHDVDGIDGKLLVSFLPGKKQAYSFSTNGGWERDLDTDLDRLVDEYGVAVIVCLVEEFELTRYEVPHYAEACAKRNVVFVHLPIRDGSIPSVLAAQRVVDLIWGALAAGDNVLVHCKGGLGRAGTIAACTLVACGHSADEAITKLRTHRDKRAVENRGQEVFIEMFASAYGPK